MCSKSSKSVVFCLILMGIFACSQQPADVPEAAVPLEFTDPEALTSGGYSIFKETMDRIGRERGWPPTFQGSSHRTPPCRSSESPCGRLSTEWTPSCPSSRCPKAYRWRQSA